MTATKAKEILLHVRKDDPESLRGVDEAVISLLVWLDARVAELEAELAGASR